MKERTFNRCMFLSFNGAEVMHWKERSLMENSHLPLPSSTQKKRFSHFFPRNIWHKMNLYMRNTGPMAFLLGMVVGVTCPGVEGLCGARAGARTLHVRAQATCSTTCTTFSAPVALDTGKYQHVSYNLFLYFGGPHLPLLRCCCACALSPGCIIQNAML